MLKGVKGVIIQKEISSKYNVSYDCSIFPNKIFFEKISK